MYDSYYLSADRASARARAHDVSDDLDYDYAQYMGEKEAEFNELLAIAKRDNFRRYRPTIIKMMKRSNMSAADWELFQSGVFTMGVKRAIVQKMWDFAEEVAIKDEISCYDLTEVIKRRAPISDKDPF